MKIRLWVAVVAVLASPVLAQARDWRGGQLQLQAQGQRMEKKGPGPFKRGEQDKRKDFRDRPDRDRDRHDRLTEEERRELHRDLDRARREIYRRHPPR